MSIGKKFLVIIFIVGITSVKVSGQAGRSPFSTFGLGDHYGNGLAHNQGIGGMGVSLPQFWYINNQNPALLVHNMNTVFQAGIVGERKTITQQSISQKGTSGNLNYLVTAFPVSKRPGYWTTSLGLMPYTTVNYGLQYTNDVFDNNGVLADTAVITETGSGGISQFYWSNGVRINRQLSLGIKAAYLFGPIENIYDARIPDPRQAFPYRIELKEKTSIKDFMFSLGAAYTKDSLGRKQNYKLHFGAVYEIPTKLKATRRVETARHDFSTRQRPVDGDTLFSTRGQISLPGSVTLGVSLSRGNRWSIGTEFNYQDWSSFRSVNQDDEGLGKAWRAAIGGEITPDPLAFESFLKRITYRVGLSYERLPYLVDQNPEGNFMDLRPVNDYGINFGLSIPTGRSSLDLAFKVGKRGDKQENLLEETYFKVYFGITFNEQWFIKRKFD